MQLQPGQIVGEYRVLEPLGSGGTGRVFKVEHLVTKRQEAMKLLLAGGAATPEQVQRFEREIRLQATLRHPNIAPVYNAFFHNQCLFMVMELLEGTSLERLIEGGMLPLDRALSIMQQVLSALDHAHSRGVLHRDISTANIMVGARDEVKLTDFGLAIHREDVRITASGTPVGSYYYMSPEQVRGREGLDPRTDLYSCGAVLYEMVTGRKPFMYADAFSLMEAHTQEEPLPPRQLQPSLPPALETVILRAMAKDRTVRYATAAEFLEALSHACAVGQKPAKADRPWLAFAASVGVVLITVSAALWFARLPTNAGPAAAPASSAIATPVATVSPTMEDAPPPMPALPQVESALPEPEAKPQAIRPVRTAQAKAAHPASKPQATAKLVPVIREPDMPLPGVEEPPRTIQAPVVQPAPVQPAPPPPAVADSQDPTPGEPAVRRPGRFGRLRVLNPARIFQRGSANPPAKDGDRTESAPGGTRRP
jgi:serine/threonine-protein kinase